MRHLNNLFFFFWHEIMNSAFLFVTIYFPLVKLILNGGFGQASQSSIYSNGQFSRNKLRGSARSMHLVLEPTMPLKL